MKEPQGKSPDQASGYRTGTHPRSLVCDDCGNGLELTRYEKNRDRYRKYACPRCGFTAVYKRARFDKPDKYETSRS